MAAEPSALLPLARRGPFRLAIGFGMLQLAVLGIVALKISFQEPPPGILGEGGSEVLLTHETRAIFGYFALVLLGILGTVWYVKARQPRGVLRLVAISALLANGVAVFLGDLLALAIPGLVFAFAVLITDQIGRRSRHAHGKPQHS